jgi:large subunit ribosomal protein L10
LKLTEKKSIVEDLHERLLRSKIAILTTYKGLNVAQMTELRKRLREADVEFQVVKNTLLTRASESTGVSVIQDSFKGPTAIALSFHDPVAAAKVLTGFAKDNEKLDIRVGVLNGKVVQLDGIKVLSSLPSREILLAQVLGAMNAVPASFVRVLNNVPVSLMNVLQAIKEKKEAA